MKKNPEKKIQTYLRPEVSKGRESSEVQVAVVLLLIQSLQLVLRLV
jgi:hypothetical protein